MQEQETVYPNDTTRAIRGLMSHIQKWREGNDRADQRAVAIVLTKLEEAELFSLRMVKGEDNGTV